MGSNTGKDAKDITLLVAMNAFTWTTGNLYTNPKFLTTFRGRGEFSSGSFSTTN